MNAIDTCAVDVADTRRLLRKAAIAGVYTTEVGNLTGRTADDLILEAISGAAADSGLTLHDIDGIVGGRSPTPSAASAFPGYWSEMLGHSIRYHTTPDVASGGHCGNILHAALAVACGLANNVAVIGGGHRGGDRKAAVEKMASAHGEFDTSWGTLVPSWFALVARRHMHEFGTTSEQLAEIAVSTRKWASMHPQAMMKDPITIDDVINSRMISDPLHLLDCCLSSDGAGAMIISRAAQVADGPKKPVYVLGGAEDYSFRGYVSVCHDWLKSGALETGRRAMEMAGVKHSEFDMLGLYDCFTITVLRTLEDLGFCKVGEGGDFVSGGRLAPGGALPTNTHGGGLSWGHNYSGLAHAIEITRQMRGEAGPRQVKDVELALAHSQGGPLALHSTVVLSSVL
ncbi:thiolase C-terminal domain-containing protein [Pigmentiphaga soli]|uniref:thiolase C-terminal domain-containing protein n=1 Tax=Pigmentiphaga soli TaxID=1007095 RepID=UPI0031E78712